MKYSFGLLALAGLAVATPVQKRQDIDFDAYNSVPTETPIAAPEGVTAAQSTTLPYNPSAAASSAANAAPTNVIYDQAPTTTSGPEKRDTPAGVLTSGCTAAVQAGNAPLTSPDTPQDFLANSVYSSAALNAQTPNGYTLAFSNQPASAEDPSYLTYTTKGMTSYDPNICASLCTDEAGCFSFNIYYERDPAYTTNADCTNPPSTVYLKCALYGAPLTASSATNGGQWRKSFRTEIAGSNAYTRSTPNAIPGWTGPVPLGNAAIKVQTTSLGSQNFPQSQPFDPSVCAAACKQLTANAKAAAAPNGLYNTCRFFDAYVLYKNGFGGVFTCTYYSQAWDPSNAINVGQDDAKGNHYTIGHSYSYTLVETDTVGTGLNYYRYNNPYTTYDYPSLSVFQGTNYVESGIIQNLDSIYTFPQYYPQNYCQIPGMANMWKCDYTAIVFHGYFIAPETGTYSFNTPQYNIDDVWFMWHGDTAISGWNRNNFDVYCIWEQSSNYQITLTKGYVLPVTFLWGNTGGAGKLGLQVTLPSGVTKTDTTGLFSPSPPGTQPFAFTN